METHQERQKYSAHTKFVQFDCRLHSSHFSQQKFSALSRMPQH